MLSGNRNFEGRVNADVRANYLASPPLVVAYAHRRLDAGRSGQGAARHRQEGQEGLPQGHLADEHARSTTFIRKNVTKQMFAKKYADVFKGDANWRKISVKGGLTYDWDNNSTYVQNPPYFTGMKQAPDADRTTSSMRACSACSSTRSPPTTSRRPARSSSTRRPANICVDHKVKPIDFNQYGTRRGNHEVMMRGTFANIRIKNQMVPGVEGGVTIHYPSTAADADLRRGHALQGREGAARGVRRQGIRHRLLARLGGQGHRSCSASAR